MCARKQKFVDRRTAKLLRASRLRAIQTDSLKEAFAKIPPLMQERAGVWDFTDDKKEFRKLIYHLGVTSCSKTRRVARNVVDLVPYTHPNTWSTTFLETFFENKKLKPENLDVLFVRFYQKLLSAIRVSKKMEKYFKTKGGMSLDAALDLADEL